jgi:murein L,D-transpeptidase YafK
MRPQRGPEIFIDRTARLLRLVAAGEPERRYPVAIGRNADADKAVEGDCATPLGEFTICARNPRSRFFLSLCLSYPNEAHAARGLRDGLIDAAVHAAILAALRAGTLPPQKTRLGGEIYIHGADPGGRDWTHGCVALANSAMLEVYDRVRLGTWVLITR